MKEHSKQRGAFGAETPGQEPSAHGPLTSSELPWWSAILVALVSLPIRVYRLAISPLLPRACRFYPSCSQYALGALRVHGLLRGSWLALARLVRCHPFHPGGVDPVPPRNSRSGTPLSSPAAPCGRGN